MNISWMERVMVLKSSRAHARPFQAYLLSYSFPYLGIINSIKHLLLNCRQTNKYLTQHSDRHSAQHYNLCNKSAHVELEQFSAQSSNLLSQSADPSFSFTLKMTSLSANVELVHYLEWRSTRHTKYIRRVRMLSLHIILFEIQLDNQIDGGGWWVRTTFSSTFEFTQAVCECWAGTPFSLNFKFTLWVLSCKTFTSTFGSTFEITLSDCECLASMTFSSSFNQIPK